MKQIEMEIKNLGDVLAVSGRRTEMGDCNKCLWATRDGGCASWSCEFIPMREAAKVWKEANQNRSGSEAEQKNA